MADSDKSLHPLATPCDLWVLPPPRVSLWFARVDWYLNWQLSKGLAYAGLHLPIETHHLAEEYEVPLATAAVENPPLLVLSHGRIPADKCVVVDMTGKNKSWLEQVHQVAEGLQVKNLHIFLPAKLDKEEAKEVWSSQFASRKARFSTDSEARA